MSREVEGQDAAHVDVLVPDRRKLAQHRVGVIGRRLVDHGLETMGILVANSVSDHVAGCRAAKREQRVLAVGVAMCQSAILIRLTAAAVMTCCKWVLARPI